MRDKPILYLFLYDLMVKKAERTNFVTHKELIELLQRRLQKIPRNIISLIIKDFEKYNLIQKHGTSRNLTYELLAEDAEKIIRREIGLLY